MIKSLRFTAGLNHIGSVSQDVFKNWNYYIFSDEFLSWNPKQFNGLTSLHVPSDMIWKPGTVLNPPHVNVYSSREVHLSSEKIETHANQKLIKKSGSKPDNFTCSLLVSTPSIILCKNYRRNNCIIRFTWGFCSLRITRPSLAWTRVWQKRSAARMNLDRTLFKWVPL